MVWNIQIVISVNIAELDGVCHKPLYCYNPRTGISNFSIANRGNYTIELDGFQQLHMERVRYDFADIHIYSIDLMLYPIEIFTIPDFNHACHHCHVISYIIELSL